MVASIILNSYKGAKLEQSQNYSGNITFNLNIKNVNIEQRKNSHTIFPLIGEFSHEIFELDCTEDKIVISYLDATEGKGIINKRR
jgi:hypothetical protein